MIHMQVIVWEPLIQAGDRTYVSHPLMTELAGLDEEVRSEMSEGLGNTV